jgi:mxaA protein
MMRSSVCLLQFWLILLAVTACSPNRQESISRFELQAPKPYGYVIGDEIYHRIIVETRQQLEIIQDSIPALGERNRWLNLKAAKLTTQANDGGKRYLLELTYQVFYAPLEVKMLKIPGFTLRFQQYGNTIEQAVPAWHFTLSPLHELAIRKEDGKIYLRPDAQPGLIDTRIYQNGVATTLALFAASGIYLAFCYGLMPWVKQRKHFKTACKKLSGFTRQQLEQALTATHEAINKTYNKPLFKHCLTDFYTQQPQFKPLSEQIDWFLAFSDRYFFSDRKYCTEEEFSRLKALCLDCRKIERGGV